MRIRLRSDLRLSMRNAVGQGGYHQDFILVLVIMMLEDEALYQAVDVASTAWNAATQNIEYTRQARKLYRWANQPNKNIAGTPDNINPDTGKKFAHQRAKWYGKTWKKCLSDVLWNTAVDIFENVRNMAIEDQEAGLVGVEYWWDDELNAVTREVPEQPIEEAKKDVPELSSDPALVDPPVMKRKNRIFPIVAMVAALAVLLLFLPRSAPSDLPAPVFPVDSPISSNLSAMAVDDYLSRYNRPVDFSFSGPLTDEETVKTWRVTSPTILMLAKADPPPPLFFANCR